MLRCYMPSVTNTQVQARKCNARPQRVAQVVASQIVRRSFNDDGKIRSPCEVRTGSFVLAASCRIAPICGGSYCSCKYHPVYPTAQQASMYPRGNRESVVALPKCAVEARRVLLYPTNRTAVTLRSARESVPPKHANEIWSANTRFVFEND